MHYDCHKITEGNNMCIYILNIILVSRQKIANFWMQRLPQMG